MSSLTTIVTFVNRVLNVQATTDNKSAWMPEKYDNTALHAMANTLVETGEVRAQSTSSFQDGIVFLMYDDICFSIDRNGRIWA